MYYTKRRELRQRMMRRSAIIRQIQDVVTSVWDFIPELMSGIAILFVIFFLIPLLFGGIAAASQMGVIP